MDIDKCTFDTLSIPEVSSFDVWRWDKIHPTVSGNKWFKLLGHEQHMLQGGYTTMVTFGGAHSNHLHAAAHFCMERKYKAVIIVRGDELGYHSNPTLRDIRETGADIHFVKRQDYAAKEQSEAVQDILSAYKHYHIVPEGGAGRAGEEGFGILKAYIPEHVSHICVSVGTGTSLRGIRNITPREVKLIGFSSFKDLSVQFPEQWLREQNTELVDCTQSGRFGRATPDLINFIQTFSLRYGIPLDLIYTGKMFRKIMGSMLHTYFQPSDRVLAIHTGGLQGNRSVLAGN